MSDAQFYREYHATNGRVLGVGDVVKVRGRDGRRYRFAAWVESHDRYCLLRGEHPRHVAMKFYRVRPEAVERVRVAYWPQTKRMKRRDRDEPALPYDGDAAPEPHEEPDAASVRPDTKVVTETLTCRECGRDWQRRRKRGRKPKSCPDCKRSK